MRDRLLFLGVTLILIAGALFIISDKARRDALRAQFGMEPQIRTELDRLAPDAIEAEIARLAAQPVPGLPLTEADEPPLEMGVLAGAARDCLVSTGAVVREPKLRARQAMLRYLLILGAIGTDPDSPLLEERFRPLRPLFLDGPVEAQRRLATGGITAEQLLLLAEFHVLYSEVDHPAYHGLQLYDKTFEALDFQAMTRALAERPAAVLDCALANALPGKKAGAENEAAGTEEGSAATGGEVGN